MKKIILLTTVIAVIFSMTCFVHADTSGGETNPEDIIIEEDTGAPADPQATSCTMSFKKTSSTKARAQASALRPKASSITSVIYLQKKKNGAYSSVDSDSKTVQSSRINHIHTFTVQSTGTYRIKVVIKYKKDGTTYSNTYYQKLKASDELESEL